MPSRTIQVPVDAELLEQISRFSKLRCTSRAAFIRAACQYFLTSLRVAEAERKYIEGYTRIPEDGHVAKVSMILAARVLPDEDWS